MKRIFSALVVLLLSAIVVPAHQAAAQSTNNFTITSYGIQYELSADAEGRSVLTTTEVIKAEFPQSDQNHGLERAIPTSYDGHSVDLKVQSITDDAGKAWKYSTNNTNDVAIIRIGDADTYVHGTQTFKLVYTQHDVTRFYKDTGRSEWYWDTNGTEWQVPIQSLTVSISIDKALVSTMSPPYCYQGYAGSTTQCTLQPGPVAGQYTVAAEDFSPGENITVAFGFTPGTFAQYKASPFAILVVIWTAMQFIAIPLAILLITIFGIIAWRRHNRISETHEIPAEYIPPKDASVTVSAQIVGRTTVAFSAQLIDLAVRHVIAIVETSPKSMWRPADYDIVLQSDPTVLRAEEKELISDLFGHPKVGDRLALSSLRSNPVYTVRLRDNDTKLKALVENKYHLREKSPEASRFFRRWAIAVLVLSILLLNFSLLCAVLFIWIYGVTIRPLTDSGLALRRYVLGLDKYIQASETERLKFLQGPDTAEKVGYDVDTNNPGQMVKLYERVLPYAILFGREKKWAQQLGNYYAQTSTSPDWYTGRYSTFNAVVFASALQSFSQTSAYSASSSSSSTGGSSGGGSSGGGGGGGGGGGW